MGIEMADIWNSARLWQGVCAYLIILLLILSSIEDRHLRKAQKTLQPSMPTTCDGCACPNHGAEQPKRLETHQDCTT